MTKAYRLVLVLSVLCAALAGGLLATVFAPKPVLAADASASSAALAFGPQIKVTGMQIPFTFRDLNADVYVKVADVGFFTVENTASLIEVIHQGRIQSLSTTSATGIYAQLRVDDMVPMDNSGQVHTRISEDGIYTPFTFSGYWQGLSAGTHTVSIWAHMSQGGSTGHITINPGNWASNDVIVKEYLPFGATYLPSITNEQGLEGTIDPGMESDTP